MKTGITEASKIQILYKPEGIRISIKPDYFMQKKWQRYFGMDFTLADTIREKIPEGLFSDDEIKCKERIFYFNCHEQTLDVVLKIVLHHSSLNRSKNFKIWNLIFDLCTHNKLYIKAISEIVPNKKNILKTMLLAGDETTGVINNL